MSKTSMSTIAMIRALRDHLEQRVLQSEDYRALAALDRHLAVCEKAARAVEDDKAAVAERRSHLRLLCFDGGAQSPVEHGLNGV